MSIVDIKGGFLGTASPTQPPKDHLIPSRTKCWKILKQIVGNILIGNMRLNKRDLLMLWRFSTFNSVREVAQNPDILKLIFTELEPMFQYDQVVTEYNDPRFKAHFKRIFKQAASTSIHPGHWLVHIIYVLLHSSDGSYSQP